MGPASHTRLAACSDNPSCRRNGVPHLGWPQHTRVKSTDRENAGLIIPANFTHPNSIVQIICAPPIEIESAIMSSVDMRVLPRSAVASPLDPLREPLRDETGVPSSSSDAPVSCEPKLPARRIGAMGGR